MRIILLNIAGSKSEGNVILESNGVSLEKIEVFVSRKMETGLSLISKLMKSKYLLSGAFIFFHSSLLGSRIFLNSSDARILSLITFCEADSCFSFVSWVTSCTFCVTVPATSFPFPTIVFQPS